MAHSYHVSLQLRPYSRYATARLEEGDNLHLLKVGVAASLSHTHQIVERCVYVFHHGALVELLPRHARPSGVIWNGCW